MGAAWYNIYLLAKLANCTFKGVDMKIVNALAFIATIAIVIVVINAIFLGGELIRDRLNTGEKEPITE